MIGARSEALRRTFEVRARGQRRPSPQLLSCLLGMVLLSPPSPAAASQLGFAPYREFAMGTDPLSIVLADFNRDGHLDMATANSGSNSVSIRFGSGTGTFGSVREFQVGAYPIAIAVGDIEGDGILDLVIANYFEHTATVLRGLGDGSFATGYVLTTGVSPRDAILRDVNGDQRADLVVANTRSNSMSVWLAGDEGVLLARSDYATGRRPRALAVGDLNGDGQVDLACANNQSNSVSIRFGDGAGLFGVETVVATGLSPSGVLIADVTGDGQPDLVTADVGIPANEYRLGALSVIPGDGRGAFSTRWEVATGREPVDIGFSDVNGDLLPDLLAANRASNTISVILRAPNGTYQDKQDFGATLNPWSLAIGDLNEDGRPDLAVASTGPSTTSVFLNRSAAVIPNDARIAFAPYRAYALPYEPQSVAAGDTDGDGVADIAIVASESWPDYGMHLLLAKGTGSGSFTPSRELLSAVGARRAVIGDLDRDGRNDLATMNASSLGSIVTVMLGQSGGEFGPAKAVAAPGQQIEILDMNLDSLPDVVTSDRVLLGDGTGALVPLPSYAAIFAGSGSIGVGDASGDGLPDIFMPTGHYGVSLFRGQASGNVAWATEMKLLSDPSDLEMADVNGDGRADLSAVTSGPRTVSVLLSSGGDTFVARADYGAGPAPATVKCGDLNGDGWPDLIVAGLSSDTVSVLLGNGNGTFSMRSSFRTAGSVSDLALADLNADGRLDLVVANPRQKTMSLLLNTSGDVPTPTSISHFSASWNEGGVRIAWSVMASPSLGPLRLQRSLGESGEWLELDRLPSLEGEFRVILDDGVAAWEAPLYRLVGTRADGTAFVLSQIKALMPQPAPLVSLAPLFPNPASARLTVTFALPSRQTVRLALIDLLGRELRTLVDGVQPAGRHVLEIDGVGLQPGIYLVRLQSDGADLKRKLVVVR